MLPTWPWRCRCSCWSGSRCGRSKPARNRRRSTRRTRDRVRKRRSGASRDQARSIRRRPRNVPRNTTNSTTPSHAPVVTECRALAGEATAACGCVGPDPGAVLPPSPDPGEPRPLPVPRFRPLPVLPEPVPPGVDEWPGDGGLELGGGGGEASVSKAGSDGSSPSGPFA